MPSRLIIDGNSVYEIDEECEKNRLSGEEKTGERNRPVIQEEKAEQEGTGR